MLSLLPVFILSKKWFQVFLKWIFVLVNTVALAINFIDIKFFEFSEKRITSDVLNSNWLGDDFVTMLPNFIVDYWFVFLLFFMTLALLIKAYPNYNSRYIKVDKIAVVNVSIRWLLRVLVLGIFVLGGRGGFQLKPINTIVAAKYSTPKNMPLILNSAFTLMKSIGDKPLKPIKYFENDELARIYNPVRKFENAKLNNKNVVLIILESFGKEYSGLLNDTIGYTPNLDSIMTKGLTFHNCFANGKRSIEGLPSILSGLPALMDKPFITSNFTSNSINSIGSCLGAEGYETMFFHGGKNGTMGFDNFVRLAGIEKYYGLDEYPGNEFDGGWGIYDEPYLKYFADVLNETSEPFFSGVFTLSSHHPYNIPEEYVGKFNKGKLVNHESINYADYALGQFFKYAEKMDWYKNTLFVLTADHTAQTEGGYYTSSIGRYAIPLVLYAPGDTVIVGESDLVCSQADIFPSIMDYLGYSKPFIAFGESVLNDSVQRYSTSFVNGVYQLLVDSVGVTSNGKELFSAYDFNDSSLRMIDIKDSIPSRVNDAFIIQKAIVQQYINRMIENELTIVTEE